MNDIAKLRRETVFQEYVHDVNFEDKEKYYALYYVLFCVNGTRASLGNILYNITKTDIEEAREKENLTGDTVFLLRKLSILLLMASENILEIKRFLSMIVKEGA